MRHLKAILRGSGSLLGRLINSTLRKQKIKLNRMKIKSLASQCCENRTGDGLLGNYLNETEKRKKLFYRDKKPYLGHGLMQSIEETNCLLCESDDTDAYPYY